MDNVQRMLDFGDGDSYLSYDDDTISSDSDDADTISSDDASTISVDDAEELPDIPEPVVRGRNISSRDMRFVQDMANDIKEKIRVYEQNPSERQSQMSPVSSIMSIIRYIQTDTEYFRDMTRQQLVESSEFKDLFSPVQYRTLLRMLNIQSGGRRTPVTGQIRRFLGLKTRSASKTKVKRKRKTAKKPPKKAAKKKKTAQRKRNVAKKTQKKRTKKTHKNLASFWHELATGNMIALVMADGTIKRIRKNINKVWKESEENDDVEAVITSAMSWDTFERLEERSNGLSPTKLLQNYKKYFNKKRVMTSKDWVV